MAENSPIERETIPDRFESLEEAAEFWDQHDVAGYDDLTREAHFEINIERRSYLAALDPERQESR